MGLLERMGKIEIKTFDAGEFLQANTIGQILIHGITLFDAEKSGLWGALKGEIVSISAKTPDVVPYPVGTKIRIMYRCHGKYADIGMKELKRAVLAAYAPEDEAEVAAALKTCFGEDGRTEKATKAEREAPLFAARGVLVDFSTKPAKGSDDRAKEGKPTFVDVKLSAVAGQTAEGIAAAAKRLPEVN